MGNYLFKANNNETKIIPVDTAARILTVTLTIITIVITDMLAPVHLAEFILIVTYGDWPASSHNTKVGTDIHVYTYDINMYM